MGLKDHFRMLRLDIGSDLGQYVRGKYQGGVVPTFIAFDKRGDEVWRQTGGVPSLGTILSLDL